MQALFLGDMLREDRSRTEADNRGRWQEVAIDGAICLPLLCQVIRGASWLKGSACGLERDILFSN